MAKLSFKINSGSDNDGYQPQQPSSISLSKKVVEEDGPDTAASATNRISASVFSVQPQPSDAAPDTASPDIAASAANEADIEAIVAERMAQKVAKYNAKFQEMRQQMDALESEKMEIQKQLNSTIQASVLVDEVFGARDGASDHQKRLIDTLREALDTADDENLTRFIIKFAKGWVVLQRSLSMLADMEKGKPQLDAVCDALQFLLACISGSYISERRTLLELVARHCCEYFQEYIFISPEHTLNLDPEIHNVESAGSSTIKEGVSFAVIRSDTKKTVRYADVVLA